VARQLTASAPSAVDRALTITGGAAAGAGYAVLGLALGVLIPNQIGAASTGLLYTLVAEPLISKQSYEVYLKLPGGAREALVRHTSASHHIPAQPVGLITWASGRPCSPLPPCSCTCGVTPPERRATAAEAAAHLPRSHKLPVNDLDQTAAVPARRGVVGALAGVRGRAARRGRAVLVS